MMSSIGQKNTNWINPYYWCISLSKVQAFNLSISFSNKPCLVLCDNTKFILLVPKNLFGVDQILLWSWYQLPNFISLEVVQLFLHGNNLIRVLKSLFHTKRFQRGGKRVECTKVCQPWVSCHPSLNAPKYVVYGMIPLNHLMYSWVWCLRLTLN
jgi:hypothetical protein